MILATDLTDMFGEDAANPRKLHPDLHAHLEDHPILGVMLRHPLVYQVPFYSWKLANAQLLHKQEATRRAKRTRSWGTFLALHERPYRLPVLHDLHRAGMVTKKELRKLLPKMWVDAELPWTFGGLVPRLFEAAGFVSDCGAKRPKAPVTVYRGQSGDHPPGFSWTTDPDKAAWFARRFAAAEPVVYRVEAPPAAVLAILEGRGEREVVVHPGRLPQPVLVPLV